MTKVTPLRRVIAPVDREEFCASEWLAFKAYLRSLPLEQRLEYVEDDCANLLERLSSFATFLASAAEATL